MRLLQLQTELCLRDRYADKTKKMICMRTNKHIIQILIGFDSYFIGTIKGKIINKEHAKKRADPKMMFYLIKEINKREHICSWLGRKLFLFVHIIVVCMKLVNVSLQ